MAINLRERAESDLQYSLEGEFGLPVHLTDPDGVDHTVYGRVLYDTLRTNPVTGEDVIVNNPLVVLRRASLARVPAAGENWLVRVPERPELAADLADFVLDPGRPPEGGGSIGFIRLYLRRAAQS